MADPRALPPGKQVPTYQQDIRKNTLKKVARLLSDYYQSIKKQVSQDELKKETFDIVKEMDHIAGQDSRDESDYNAIMTNQFNLYKAHLTKKRNDISNETDPLMMATVMINSLPKLQDFLDHTEFLPNDLKLIQQLIQFIKSIPSNNYGVNISKPDQVDAVKVYYEKLFIPIQKTIENRQFPNQMMQQPQSANQNQMPTNAQQKQQMMQQMIQAQGIQPSVQPPMQQLMQQQQQMQRPQITPSMSQQMPSPNQQDPNAIPRQMPVPTPQNGIPNTLQQQQQPQGQQHPGLAVPLQPQSQPSQQQLQQQMQPIQQQPSVQQLQQVQQQPNPRSPQKPRSPRSPQMMQQVQQQQQMHGMNMPVNPIQQQSQMPPPPTQSQQQQMQGRQQGPVDNSDFIKQLFSSVRADCAVFYSTPHPPHF